MRNKFCGSCGGQLDENDAQPLCAGCLLKIALADPPTAVHLRCPNCRQAIELVEEITLTAVTCPSCDSRFSLVDGEATLPLTPEILQRIEQFELIECVGQGAFGTVWKALDHSLDRIVAVKVPREQTLSPEAAETFLREARAAAQLSHPGIVRVYEVGRAAGRVYIVSEFVDGVTLADFLQSERLSANEVAGWCLSITEALQHAHGAGVVHRDLKPSNILLRRVATEGLEGGEQRDVDASFDSRTPLLTDFGLARRDTGEMTITADGRILGTPAYMSPEQAGGEGHRVDGRSDLYSLGVILFEMLTGDKPFRGNSRMLIDQVLHQDAPSPRQLNHTVPKDLATICLKCMEKTPARRYGTAADLAADLRRFLSGHAIEARPVSQLEKGVRWCRRNSLVSTLVLCVAVSLLIGLATTLWQWQNSENHRRQAISRSHEAMNQIVRMHINKGNDALSAGDPLQALVWYSEALVKNNSADTSSQDTEMNGEQSSSASSILRRQSGIVQRQLPKLAHCLTHNAAEIESAHYNADGSRIVTTSQQLVRLWDSHTGQPIVSPLSLDGNITRAAFSPSGRLLFVLSGRLDERDMDPSDGRIDILDARTGEATLPTIKIGQLNVLHLTVSPDETFFAVAAGNQVHVLNIETGEPRLPPIDHGCRVCHVEISPDGTRMVSCGHDIESSAMAVLYDLESEQEVGRWEDKVVNSAGDEEYLFTSRMSLSTGRSAFSPDGKRFATFKFDVLGGRTSGPGIADLRDSQSGELHHELESKNWIESVRFSLDSEQAFVHSGGTPLVYRVRDGKSLDLNLPEDIASLHLLPDGTFLTVKSIASATEVRHHTPGNSSAVTFLGQPERLTSRHDSSGFALAVRGADKNRGESYLYDMATESTVSFSAWHRNVRAEFHPDADRFLELRHGIVRQWDLAAHSSRRVDLPSVDDKQTSATALSSSGKVLAIGSGKPRRDKHSPEGAIRFIHLPSDEVLSKIARSSKFPWSFSGSFDVGPLIDLPGKVQDIHFCHDDESRVAVIVDGGEAFVINRGDTSAISVSPADDRYVYQIAWREADKLVMLVAAEGPKFIHDRLTESRKMHIETWTVSSTPKRIASTELPNHSSVYLSPRGNRLLLTTSDGEMLWLDAASGDLINRFGKLPRPIENVCWSGDQQRMAIIFQDERLGVWDTQSGKRIAPLLPDVSRARFSHDGLEVITNSRTESVRLWNAATSDPLSLAISVGQMNDTPSFVILPWLSADKQTLISSSDHGVRVWDVASDDRPPQMIQRDALAASGFVIDAVGGYLPVSVDEFCERLEIGAEGALSFYDTGTPFAEDRQRWHEDQGTLLFGRPYRAFQGWGELRESPIRSLPSRFHLMRINTNRPDALRRRGLAHRYAGDNRSAIADFDRVLEADADDGEVWVHRGLAKFTIGEVDAARPDIVNGIRLGIDEDLLNLGHPMISAAAAEGLASRLQANSALTDDVKLDLLIERGRYHLQSRMWHEAIDDFTEANVDQSNLRGERGSAWMGLGNWQAAIDDLSRRVETIDWYEETHLRLAVAYAMAGNFAAAYQTFHQIGKMRYTPPLEVHSAWLMILLLDPEAKEEAIAEQRQILLSAVKVALEDITSNRRRGTGPQKSMEAAIALLLSDLDEEGQQDVLRWIEHLLAENPDDPEIILAHSLALWRIGNSQQAAESLQRLKLATSEWSTSAKLLQSLVQQTLGDRYDAAETLHAAEDHLEGMGGTNRWQYILLRQILRQWHEK